MLLPLHIICIALLLHIASVAIVVIVVVVVVVGHIKCMALCSWATDELPAVGGGNTGQPAAMGLGK